MTEIKIAIPEQEIEVEIPAVEVPPQEIMITIPGTWLPSRSLTVTLPAYTTTGTVTEEAEQIRGVRIQAGSCSDAAECRETFACLGRAGANAAFYSANTSREYFSRLSYVVPEARERGMKVYALLVGSRLGWPTHPEWNARHNFAAVPENWLDFTLPAAREYVANAAREIVMNYDVDGILLDRTRWNGGWIKKAGLGHQAITETVRGVYDAVKAARPDALVAASPSADIGFAKEWWGQDWPTWLDNDWVDFVTPMAYAPNETALHRMLSEWQATSHFPERIIPRLAVVWFSPVRAKTASEMTSWVQICYDAGGVGMTLWDDRHLCQNPALVAALGAGGW